ncbi:PadR family transcriptional regulator [Saccharomonospora sp. NPDC006951]
MSERARPRSPLAMVVLVLLSEDPMHPYRMQQLIKSRRKDDVVNVARSNSIYQTIDRLLRDGLIEVQEKRMADLGPGRIVYGLTEEGKRTVERWINTMLASPAREFPEFRAVLAMVAGTDPGVVREQLERRAAALAATLAQLEEEMRQAGQFGLPRVLVLENEYAIVVTRAELRWVEQVVADLGSGELAWSVDQLDELRRKHEPNLDA